MNTQQNVYPKKYSRQQIRKAERILNDPKKAPKNMSNIEKLFFEAEKEQQTRKVDLALKYYKEKKLSLWIGVSVAALVALFVGLALLNK